MSEAVCYVETPTVKCDGNVNGAGAGHPLVYLNLGEAEKVECPYCGQTFVRKE
jgi:uncharacterized Zn-finger protein